MFLASLHWPRSWTPVNPSFLWSVWTASHQWSGGVSGSEPCQGPVGWSLLWLTMLWSHTRAGFWLFPGTLFLVFSHLLHKWYSKFAKNSKPASGFCFCLGNVLFPGLPLVKCDTKVCCFFILLQGGPTKSDGASFFFGDRVKKVVEDLSLLTATHHFSVQLLSLSATNYILYVAVVAYSSLHQITKSSAYNAGFFFFFCLPQLYLWGSPFWGEIFAYVTFFNPIIKVVTFRLHAGCVFVAGIHPSRTWTSGSFESVR